MVRCEDVIRAILLIIKKDLFGEVFNVVSEEHPSRKAYYIDAAKFLFQKSILAESDEEGKTVDGTKFANQAGFSYQYSLFEWDAFYNTTELT